MIRKYVLAAGASLLLSGAASAERSSVELPGHLKPEPADHHDVLTRATLPKAGNGARFAYYRSDRNLDMVRADLLLNLTAQGFDLAGGQHRALDGIEAQTLLWVKQDTRLASNLAQIDGQGTLVQFIQLPQDT